MPEEGRKSKDTPSEQLAVGRGSKNPRPGFRGVNAKLSIGSLNVFDLILIHFICLLIRSVIFFYSLPLRFMAVGRSALSGLAAMFHRNDHISLFMPLLDIAVRLDDMLQRINPVDDRFYLSRLDQFFE